MASLMNPPRNRLSPTRVFPKPPNNLSPSAHLALSSPPPTAHWSHTCHETILSLNETHPSIKLNLSGGADNGQFVALNESISLLRNQPTSFHIVKGGKVDFDEILLEVDQHKLAGYTLADVHALLETLSINNKQIKLKTVKSGMLN